MLPPGWTMKGLLELAEIRSGQVDPRLPKYRDMPLIAPDHIEAGTGRLLAIRSAREQGAISGKYVVDPGDVIYSKIRPNLMKVHQSQFSALCSADMYPMKPRAGVDGRYLASVLLGPRFTSFAIGESMRSGIPKINRDALTGYELPVPPKPEQKAIGHALNNADQLIMALERLIAKKRDVKHGLMQELLIGRTRLPGFTGEWQEVTLGELGVFFKGRGIRRDDVRASGIPCIRYGELYTTHRNYTRTTVSFVDSDVAATALPIRAGDILFAGSGETKAEIGMAAAYVGTSNAVAGGDIIVLRGRGFDPVFLGSLLNAPSLAAHKARLGQGDAVVHIGAAALGSLPFRLPGHEEQAAIASVLQDADAEIEALECRLESARAVKVGMMQELLTGRTRLPVEEDA